MIDALADGIPARTVKDEMINLESKEDELTALVASQPSAEPSLHPSLAIVYRERVDALHEALEDSRAKDEAFSIIRTLIEEVRLIPEGGQLRVEIRGALAGILTLATNGKTTFAAAPMVQSQFWFRKSSWLRELDLNQRPSGYEPDELPGCSIPR